MSNETNHMPGVCVYENALSGPLYERLARTVRAFGSERLKGNGSYTTTFWFPRTAQPSNLAEEAAGELLRLVDPVSDCIGVEWWIGRLRYGKKLRFHFDRDLALEEKTGERICPLLGSVLYLNDYPSSPTVIVDQVPGKDGKSKIPENPTRSAAVPAIANNYVTFQGNLRHGVIPDEGVIEREGLSSDQRKAHERRLTLLVNFWHRRPLAPICNDYDGSVYPSLTNGYERQNADAVLA